jgi:hypothetical protein
MVRVEMIDRLVEQQHLGILCEQCRERGAATFAARQRVDIALREIVECDSLQCFVCDGAIRITLPAPEVDVRMTADEHAVEHGRGKRVLGGLREQAEPASQCAARPVREWFASERDGATRRSAQACQRVQRQRFARAIAAENRSDCAACDRQLQVANERTSSDFDCQLAARETARDDSLRRDAQCFLQPISLAVFGPMSTCCSDCGVCACVLETGMRPAMSSANDCGYSGSRCGSAKPSGWIG